MEEFIGKDGVTTLDWTEYKLKGDALRKSQGWTAKQIKDYLGKPVINGVVVELTTGGPNTIRQRSAASRAASQANRKRKTGIYKNVDTLPKDIKDWAERLTKEGKWPEGKSLEGFIEAHKTSQKKLMSDIEALKRMGFIDDETGRSLIDDGHLIAIGKEQKTGHPLRPKGTHGSHFGEARVPELAAVNQAKREAGDIDFLDAKRGGIITDDLDAFAQYLTDDVGYGPGVKPTQSTKQRIAQSADPNFSMERQIARVEAIRQRSAYNHLFRSKVNDVLKASGKFTKVATGLGGAEAAVMLASGQVIPGTLAVAMQTPVVQKKVATLLAKQGLKLIPGLSFGSGVIQGAGYALSGQPAKALLSVGGGILGEIPGIGDAAQAAIDLGLTVDDVRKPKTSNIDMTEDGKVSKYSTGVMHTPTGKGDAAFDYVVNKLKEDPTQLDSSGFGNTISTNELIKKAGRTTRKLLK